MQKIDESLLARLQTLSMLEIKEENKERILNDLNTFLDFVDVLDELDLGSIEAVFNPITTTAPLRKDTLSSNPQIGQKILSHAPKSSDNFFIVPKIIE